MGIGLLWFDDNKDKSLEKKIDEAVGAYCAKPRFAGKTPDICYVHTSVLPEGQEIRLNGVRVVAATTIFPHHFLVSEVEGGGNGRDSSERKRERSGSSASARMQ